MTVLLTIAAVLAWQATGYVMARKADADGYYVNPWNTGALMLLGPLAWGLRGLAALKRRWFS